MLGELVTRAIGGVATPGSINVVVDVDGYALTFWYDDDAEGLAERYADFLPDIVGEDGVIRGPAGAGRVSAVTLDDLADVAALVLQAAAEHVGQTYDLTGPEDLTLAEVADTITAVTGRPVRYHAETLEEAYASRASYGAPDWQVDAWVSTYTSIAAGDQAVISADVERITGRPPLTLAELLAG